MRVRATTRVVACPDPHISRESPNDLRLSGERSGAERVRCSRGFGGGLSNASGDTRRRCASQQAFCAEIFIHIWPVDPEPRPDDLPIPALLWRCIQEPRIPHERNCDRAPVCEVHTQRILREVDIAHRLARSRFRSSHSMPLGTRPDSRKRASRSLAALAGRNRDSARGTPARAEFGRSLVAVNVDVSRFTKIMTHEVYSVRAAEENRRHLNSLTERVAERLAAQRRAQRSGASPLQPRVRRELVDEPEHGWTIRLGRGAVQRVGACVFRKPLRRKGRALLRRDLGRRRPRRNGCARCGCGPRRGWLPARPVTFLASRRTPESSPATAAQPPASGAAPCSATQPPFSAK